MTLQQAGGDKLSREKGLEVKVKVKVKVKHSVFLARPTEPEPRDAPW